MTYSSVLAIFVLPPLVILAVWEWFVLRREMSNRGGSVDWRPYGIIALHVGLALFYTTPWDNYLVANGVWWYNPNLVTGIRLGYVPIEEYGFFVVQTLLTGFWYLRVRRVLHAPPLLVLPGRQIRRWSGLLIFGLWLGFTWMLFSGWQPVTYLALILSWALLPVLIQVAFGADILLADWRVVTLTVLVPTFYLWWVDGLSIASGTWTINPAATTGVMLGALPLEEMIFFLMTNLIIGFGMTLMLSEESHMRVRLWMAKHDLPRGRIHSEKATSLEHKNRT
jgi:lycopene cyclase domain-containing protein